MCCFGESAERTKMQLTTSKPPSRTGSPNSDGAAASFSESAESGKVRSC